MTEFQNNNLKLEIRSLFAGIWDFALKCLSSVAAYDAKESTLSSGVEFRL